MYSYCAKKQEFLVYPKKLGAWLVIELQLGSTSFKDPVSVTTLSVFRLLYSASTLVGSAQSVDSYFVSKDKCALQFFLFV